MADFLLYLRGPKGAKVKTVTMRFTHNREHFERSTGVNVTERDWDEAKGRVRSRVDGASDLNRKIEVVRLRFAEAASQVEKSNLELTTETFRAAYEILMDQVTVVARNLDKIELTKRTIEEELRADIDRLTEELAQKKQQLIRLLNPSGTNHKLLAQVLEAYKDASRADVLSDNTEQNYRRAMRFFAKHLPGVTVDELSAKMLNELRDKLVKEGKRNSSIAVRFTQLKAALRHYSEEVEPTYDLKFWSKVKVGGIKKDKPTVYLTPAELAAVEAVEILDQRLNYVRYLFLVSCYTGLRHVDLNFNPQQHINGDYVSLLAQKTGNRNDLPFTHKAREVYDLMLATGYNYTWQKVGNYNRLVEQVCALVPLLHKQEPVSLDKEDPRTKPKYELVSSKVGRKTFINNCLLRNVRMDVVADWVGHQNLEMIQNHYASKKAQSESERHKIENGY